MCMHMYMYMYTAPGEASGGTTCLTLLGGFLLQKRQRLLQIGDP